MPDRLTVRLDTRTTEDVLARLRLAAVLHRLPLCHVLTGALDRALPSAADLAGQVARKDGGDDTP